MVAFKIALRFLRHSRGQTVLIALGIAVAISVQLFVGLLIGSLQVGFVDSVVGQSPQITISPGGDEQTIAEWEAVLSEVREVDDLTALTVSATSSALLTNGADAKPAVIRGFPLDDADGIYNILDRIYEGVRPQRETDVLIGRQLSEDFGIQVGEELRLITTNGSLHEVSVSGLYDLGVAAINEAWVLTPLGTAQGIFGFGEAVTSVEMQVRDVFQADAVAQDIQTRLNGQGLQVDNWKDQNQEILSALEAQTVSSVIIQAFILVAIVIAIASVLAITVLQKARQIGILKAMGIKDRQASLVFLYEGLILGALGALAGIALAYVLLTGFTASTSGAGEDPLVQIVFDYGFVALSGLIAVASALLAALIPARRSSRLSPIDVIRNG